MSVLEWRCPAEFSRFILKRSVWWYNSAVGDLTVMRGMSLLIRMYKEFSLYYSGQYLSKIIWALLKTAEIHSLFRGNVECQSPGEDKMSVEMDGCVKPDLPALLLGLRWQGEGIWIDIGRDEMCVRGQISIRQHLCPRDDSVSDKKLRYAQSKGEHFGRMFIIREWMNRWWYRSEKKKTVSSKKINYLNPTASEENKSYYNWDCFNL